MFMKSSAFLAGLLGTAHAYDVGCLYPNNPALSDAVQARNNIVFSTTVTLGGMTETPYVIQKAHAVTMCQAMCVSYHTPDMLDPLTLGPTRFTVPFYGQNAFSIVMCMSQCNQWVLQDSEYFQLMSNEGFDVEWIESEDQRSIADAESICPVDQRSCSGGCKDICALIRDDDYNPYTVGGYLGVLVRNYFDQDGFNTLGDMTYGRAVDGPVPCTGNCRLNQDTSGYAPRPNPRTLGHLNPDSSKYECTGFCRRWQPLQEGDEYGNLVQQEFVAAHIGDYGKTYLRNATLTLENPHYDLRAASLQVIDEVKMASSDGYKKAAITMMDDKLKVRRAIQDALNAEVYDSGEMSFQEYTMFLTGISTAEIDGLVQAWKEKRHHDLVRPTTVIKHWDDDILNTFSGDRDFHGPADIAARDFEAFIRVMPHPEFPSGSSCLCTTYQEYTDKWMMDRYNRTLTNFGSRYNDIVFDDMDDLREICGQSRIWGGMHYPESVPAGEEVCKGLGELAVTWSDNLRNGATFPNEFFKGDTVPRCSERR
jgi:hypothetical protein